MALPRETRTLCPSAYTGNLDLNAPFDIEQLRAALRNAEAKPTAVRWCEKTPKNVLFFGRLLKLFGEDVRLINIVRDGRDVVTSRHPKDPNRSWVGLERWVQDVGAGVPFDRHPQVLVVRYEDLVLKFKETVTRLCEFLDEDLDEAVLSWHRHTTVRSHPAWQADVTEVHGDSIGKWRLDEYRDLVAEMMADREAVRLLKHYGYVPHDARAVGVWRPNFLIRRLKRKIPDRFKTAVKNALRIGDSQKAT